MNGRECREIIELRSVGLSFAKVAFLCGCSAAKASEVVSNAERIGIRWPVPVELTDDELARLVDPRKALRFACDYGEILSGLPEGKPDLREAYRIYCARAEAAGEEPYAEPSFKRRLSAWLRTRGRAPKMNINWSPGEEIQVDWAGRKLSLTGSDGTTVPVSLFVATSPYSDYTFVRASLEMGMQSWLEHHVAMFEFFGGAPLWLAPDNLATGVVFEGRNRSIRPAYAELAGHYGCDVLPARVRSPRDKAAVESHVRIMANRIVGTLEQMEFSSIDQLNEAVRRLVDIYNDRGVAVFGGRSRREVYLSEELHCMQELSGSGFVPSTSKRVRAASDGIVTIRGNFYAVPGRFAGQVVEARIGRERIDIYSVKGGRRCQRIASHVRGEDGSETFEGLPGVSPERLKPLDEWCERHGRMGIVEQWDRERNGGKTPHDYVCRSEKRVWWRCPECGYSWQEAPARRTSRSFDDCLACSGVELVAGKNDLSALRPDLAAEWHPTRNGGLGASDVFADFRQQVWWLGACGHEWRAPIAERVMSREGALCPYCSGREALTGFNDVATVCPDLAALWHPVKNRNLTPDKVSICSNTEVYLWNGALSHIRRISPRRWLRENGRLDVLAPFESLVDEAREKDAALGPVAVPDRVPAGKSSVKWTRFLQGAGLLVSFEEWCLRFGHEDLLSEWDREKNGDLGPGDVTRASQERVWWKGPCGHSWKLSVRRRAFDDCGCPYCARRKVLADFNSVECLSASLLRFWHPTKNGDLDPQTVSDRTSRSIWWLCPDCGFEWAENLRNTAEFSRKCPACERERQGRYLVVGKNDLAKVRRDVAKQLHPSKNGGLTAQQVSAHSGRELWWLGECGHEWREPVSARTARIDSSCPYCAGRKLLRGFNDLATRNPGLAGQWHPTKNGDLAPGDVKENSSEPVWWLGECGHEWDASVAARALDGAGCPYCSGHRVLEGFNDLESRFPEIAGQWDRERNGDLRPSQVVFGSAARVWWRCDKGHGWQAPPFQRTGGRDTGCPYCGNRKVLRGFNDLRTTHPALARQWNHERNGNTKPSNTIANSCKRVWWRCERGHEWAVPVINRTRDPGHDPGCPYCNGRKVWPGFNDLATVRPDLLKEWNWIQNRKVDPGKVLPASGKTVWWIAPCGHHFTLPIRQKTVAKPGYCPICSGRRKVERPVDLG